MKSTDVKLTIKSKIYNHNTNTWEWTKKYKGSATLHIDYSPNILKITSIEINNKQIENRIKEILAKQDFIPPLDEGYIELDSIIQIYFYLGG